MDSLISTAETSPAPRLSWLFVSVCNIGDEDRPYSLDRDQPPSIPHQINLLYHDSVRECFATRLEESELVFFDLIASFFSGINHSWG